MARNFKTTDSERKIAKSLKTRFSSKEKYVAFCKHLVELYEKNPKMTIDSIVDYVWREFSIDTNYETVRRILHKHNADMRYKNTSTTYKYAKKQFNIQMRAHDVDYLHDVAKKYGRHMRGELVDFFFCMIRGRETKNMIIWLGDHQPVFFIWDHKRLKYVAFGERLSKLEMVILEELMAVTEEEGSLDHVKQYAMEKGLLYWGGEDID